jgi:putative oxidoreductase
MNFLVLAATLNFAASAAHVGIIFGGPAWYRFFGAGERFAQLSQQGHPLPALVTAGIALVLASWGFYCLALAGVIPALPAMEWVVAGIALVYALRAVPPLILAPWVPAFRTPFMIWSSLICAGFAIVHALGLL